MTTIATFFVSTYLTRTSSPRSLLRKTVGTTLVCYL